MFTISSRYATADWLSTVLYPIAFVVLLTAAGDLLTTTGVLSGWHSTPYMLAVAVCSSQVCLRAGLLCAVMSALAHNFAFGPVRWAWAVPSLDQAVSYAVLLIGAIILARRAPSRADPKDQDGPTQTLPLVGRRDGSIGRYWSVPAPTGDWGDDAALGAQYGRIYVEAWHKDGQGPLLPWIVRDMVNAGRWLGIEAGFMGVLGRAALRRLTPDATKVEMLDATTIVVVRSNDNAQNG